MSTNAEVAAKLLRSAADFFRNLGGQNDAITERMEQNARTFDMVADWVETDANAESPVNLAEVSDDERSGDAEPARGDEPR